MIGVAIPSYVRDANLLHRCLLSIEKQTRLPDLVAISVSEVPENSLVFNFSFPIKIVYSSEKQNAATNRNKAALLLADMDIISFMDADDEMHPRRLEFLEKAFRNNSDDFIVHDYIMFRSPQEAVLRQEYEEVVYEYHPNCLVPHQINYGLGLCLNNHWQFAHGHVSIRCSVFKNGIVFPEGKEYVFKEDSVFCRLMVLSGYTGGYLHCKLSKYHNYR